MRKYWLILILFLISIAHVYADDAVSDSLTSTIKKDDIFVRVILSKDTIYQKEEVEVTFRLYSQLELRGVASMDLPEFKGFKTKKIKLPDTRQLVFERYNERNFYTVDLEKVILKLNQSGDVTIPSGTVGILVNIPSGKTNHYPLFGNMPKMVEVLHTFETPKVEIKVLPKRK